MEREAKLELLTAAIEPIALVSIAAAEGDAARS